MFGKPGTNVKQAVNMLKDYGIKDEIPMTAENLKTFFGKQGIMRKLAGSNQTGETTSNFLTMSEAIILKYRSMKIQTLIEKGAKIENKEFDEIKDQVTEIINNNKEIQKIIDKNRLATKYAKAGIGFAAGGIISGLALCLPLELIGLIGEIALFSKQSKLSKEAKEEMEKLSDIVKDIKKCVKKEEKDRNYTLKSLLSFKNFVKQQGVTYIRNKKKGKFSLSNFLKSKPDYRKKDKDKKKEEKEIQKLQEQEQKGTLKIDQAKIKFATCIQNFTTLGTPANPTKEEK